MSELTAAFRQGADPPRQRAQLRQALEATGQTTASWTTEARDFMTSLSANSQLHVLGGIECFRGGCRTTVHFVNRNAFDELHQAMFSSTGRGWQGQIITSAPQTGADGSVDIEWLVLEPDEGDGT